MTSCFSLEAAAHAFGIGVTAERMDALNHELEDELASMAIYPDAKEALGLLVAEGVRIGICSNLAMPYGPPLRAMFSEASAFAFSYELGVMKPAPEIYREACRCLGVEPVWDLTASGDRVVMIGDSVRCDQDGPRAIGISGHHLSRTGRGRICSLDQFARLSACRSRCRGKT